MSQAPYDPIYVDDPFYFTPSNGGGFSLFGSTPLSTSNPATVHSTPIFSSIPLSTDNPAPLNDTPVFGSGGGFLSTVGGGLKGIGGAAVDILGGLAGTALQGAQAWAGAEITKALSSRTDAEERERFSTNTGTPALITEGFRGIIGPVVAVVGVVVALLVGFAMFRD